MNSLIRSSPLAAYPELVRDLGGDPESLLQRLHIPLELVGQEDGFLPFASLNGLYEASAKTLHCPDFGLRLAGRQGLDILGPVAVIARNAESVSSGIQALARYMHIHSPALRVGIVPHDAHAFRLTLEIAEPNLHLVSQITENSVGIGLQILKLLGGSFVRPLSVSFSHPHIADEQVYRDFFGCPVLFSQPDNGFLLPVSILAKKIEAADPEVNRIAVAYLESQATFDTVSIVDHVTQLIRRLLPTGECRIDTVAEQLCLHTRTLQRRLAAYDLRFEDVLDRERRLLAERYLAQSGLYLGQISGLLGYAEQSAFNRSCRRWFGKTPRAIRAGALTA